MNEEPTAAGTDMPEAPQETPATPKAPSGPAGAVSPVIMAALAIVPAVIVGLIVFFVAGGDSGSSGGSKAVLDGFVRLSLSDGDDVDSYNGKLPPGYPKDLPVFKGAKLDGAFAIKSPEGTTFIVTYDSTASKSDVYDYYLDGLDKDPWQIELSREADDFTGMQFSRPDSADIQGSITITKSDIDGHTAIFVFLLDASLTSSANDVRDKPIPTQSNSLPPGFPSDIPIYEGKAKSVVTDTYFQRNAGQNAFLVSFITKDADIDVINYYTKEFQKRGWVVKDGATEAGDFALNIDFDDGKSAKEVQGSIRADVYAEDGDYTEVSLIVQVSASRGRGN